MFISSFNIAVGFFCFCFLLLFLVVQVNYADIALILAGIPHHHINLIYIINVYNSSIFVFINLYHKYY